ncbi:oxygenase MpaB family protein [Geminicoccus flavidas]|uniref:oxygenase MpaB family protein n=1 Tax=Geminicoccus flavidas TaxID=2506407 RepID=UPI0013581430|nr:oxygenase MpaB family protein [Geminicoccus flavidas]
MPPSFLPGRLVQPLRAAITGGVAAYFNDGARGEKPVLRHPDGLFGPGSVTWRVHGDVASMMVGGVAALLLQMLHPAVLAGVLDHSNFRADMHGRLRRTARFVSVTTYGERALALAAIERVRRIHAGVRGTLPDGTPYAASDPDLLAWVHVAEASCFLRSWIRYGEPGMLMADQDRYFAEMAEVGLALGADPVPRNRAEARALIQAMRPRLRCDESTRDVARLILTKPASTAAMAPLHALAMDAAVDLLPGWAAQMHGLSVPHFRTPLIRIGTLGVARTLRWAFAARRAPARPLPALPVQGRSRTRRPPGGPDRSERY